MTQRQQSGSNRKSRIRPLDSKLHNLATEKIRGSERMSSRFGTFPGIVVQEGDNEQSAKLRLEMVEEPWMSRAEMVLDFLSHFPGRITKIGQ